MATKRVTLKDIPTSQIDMIVGRFHVGAPDEEIVAEIERRAESWPAAARKLAVKYALDRHHKNRAMYSSVMGGRIGRGRAGGMHTKMPAAVRVVADHAISSALDVGMDPDVARKRVYVSQEPGDRTIRVAWGPHGEITLHRPWSIADNYERVQMTLYYDGEHWYAHVWGREVSKKISQAEAKANADLFFHG